jgi:hypothetical protein
MKRIVTTVIVVTSIATLGFSATAGASAQTPTNPYSGGTKAAPAGRRIIGKTYNFCSNTLGCPYTTWTIAHKTKTFTDGFGDAGTYTVTHKVYTFVILNASGSGVTCTFTGTKTHTGFNSASSPGNFTCDDGFSSGWWLTKT